MKKILFFDIDGTLINHEGEIHPSTRVALEKLKENGQLRFLCTGRTKVMLPPELIELNFDGYVMGGGTHVAYEGEDLHSVLLEQEEINRLRKLLNERKFVYVLEGPEHLYLEKSSLEDDRDYFQVFIQKFGNLVKVIEEGEPLVANKITALYPVGQEQAVDELQAAIFNRYHVIKHENDEKKAITNGLIEIMPKPYSKAYGIEVCIDKLGYKKEQTIGIGDSNNDLEMLDYVDTAVVMGNGSVKAKNLADYITGDIDQGGIYEAMEHYKLI